MMIQEMLLFVLRVPLKWLGFLDPKDPHVKTGIVMLLYGVFGWFAGLIAIEASSIVVFALAWVAGTMFYNADDMEPLFSTNTLWGLVGVTYGMMISSGWNFIQYLL